MGNGTGAGDAEWKNCLLTTCNKFANVTCNCDICARPQICRRIKPQKAGDKCSKVSIECIEEITSTNTSEAALLAAPTLAGCRNKKKRSHEVDFVKAPGQRTREQAATGSVKSRKKARKNKVRRLCLADTAC